jgi:hypothetical protein
LKVFQNQEFFAPEGGEVRAYWEKIGNFIILLFTKYLDEKNMDDMGRECSTHGTDEKPIKILEGR